MAKARKYMGGQALSSKDYKMHMTSSINAELQDSPETSQDSSDNLRHRGGQMQDTADAEKRTRMNTSATTDHQNPLLWFQSLPCGELKSTQKSFQTIVNRILEIASVLQTLQKEVQSFSSMKEKAYHAHSIKSDSPEGEKF